MALQCMNQLTHWTDLTPEQEETLLDKALSMEAWNAKGAGRDPMTTRDQIRDYLAHPEAMHFLDRKGLRYDTDWYNLVRDGAAHRAAQQAQQAQRQPVEMMQCDCGHTVPRAQAMSASTGTACPDCYDRMS